MKHLIIGWILVFAMAIAYSSCQKEFSCEGCVDGSNIPVGGVNRPPKAVAGLDQVIKLPEDSVLLDGTASRDPDGSISAYHWTKISGPLPGTIVSPSDSVTRIRALDTGTYRFELKVTDNGGLSSMDTIEVRVNAVDQKNRPPVAKAGSDRIVQDSLTLDASASTDPDNNIATYQWTKISGPSAYQMTTPDAVKSLVTQLSSGIYQFEVKVTDAEGLFSTDTVQVIAEAGKIYVSCDNSFRSLVNAQLLPVTTMPFSSGNDFAIHSSKTDFVVHNNKMYFLTIECRECVGPAKKRAYYNIYDLTTQTWSKSSEFMVTPRDWGATLVAAGNRIFYAGGSQSSPPNYFAVLPDVDIYDVQTDTWSSAMLSKGGYNIAGAVVGNKVLFAGGLREDPVRKAKPSVIVDIYDLSGNSWSVANLSQARGDISVVSINDKVYFAGGSAGDNAISGFLGATDVIDIYDDAINTWSVSTLDHPRTYMAQIAVGNTIYWAGGLEPWEGWLSSVEIRDINTQISTRACLHQENFWWYGKEGAARMGNDKIVFFTGVRTTDMTFSTRFDIYNINSRTWSVGQLPFPIADASVFSYNNDIYVVGGWVNETPSNRIWRLVF